MKKPPLLLFLFFIILVNQALAQTEVSDLQGKKWTLRECVDYALAHNLQVKRSELNLESSEIDKTQSKMNMLPNANGSVSYGYNWGRGLDPVTNQFVSSQRNNFSSLGLNGSVTVFSWFRIQNSIRQYTNAYDASEQDLLKAKNDVTLNVITLFINIIFNKELVENARLQMVSSREQLEMTRKQVQAGSLPKVEELNLEAQVATNELNLINQENSLTFSLLQLKQAMQIPASVEFDVVIPEIEPEDLVLDQTRDEIFDIAKGTMPEIKSSQFMIESSYYAVKAARSNLYPRLSLNGSINTNYSKNSETRFVSDGGFGLSNDPIGFANDGINPATPVYAIRPTGTYQDIYGFNDQVNDNLYKSVNLSLIIPIFNNHSARANLRRSMIANEQAKIGARETENVLRQSIETAYNDAVAASKTYSSSLRQVHAREEAFRMTKQRYDVGASNYVEWQVAENNLFQARTDLSRAKYNFIFRKKLLDFYQGKSIEL